MSVQAGGLQERRNRTLIAIILICASCLLSCGHVIDGRFTGTGMKFDFRDPPCKAAPLPPTDPASDNVLVRYLGSGGLFIKWKDASLVTGPLFSNPGLAKVLFGRSSPDRRAVEEGLGGLGIEDLQAILVGHSHYDHIAEVPLIAMHLAPSARLYVNRSGARMLASYSPLAERTMILDESENSWIHPRDADGERMRFRFMPVSMEHAPQFDHHHWAAGEVERPWTLPWDEVPLRRFLAGTTHAFVIDLLDEDRARVSFRIYYQDAASPSGSGEPPRFEGPEARPYDVAVLCMASSHLARDHPGWLIRSLEPRHVVVTHYENFMRRRDEPLVFVPFLTSGRANDFMERLTEAFAQTGVPGRGPRNGICGPSGPGHSMPLPGEWLDFHPGQSATESAARPWR